MPTENKYDRILAYLKGILSHRQRHELERDMMQDVFEEEAFEGLSQLSDMELRADMNELENSLQNRITQHKKRNLKIYFRLAAGILLLAGLTGLFYSVFRTPSANLISNETVRKEEPKSLAPSAPLMETESVPGESLKKSMPEKQKRTRPAEKFISVPKEKEEIMPAKNIPVIENDSMLAQEDVIIVSYADNKMKSIEKPLINEPAPDASVKVEQALQGKAAGVQVSSKSDYKSVEPSKSQEYPVLTKPIPPGGSLKAFKKWVNDRLDYTAYKDYPGKHKIAVEITVHANGTISNIRINQDAPGVMAADMKKIISQSSLWTAALKDGNPVEADVEFRFVITVE